MPRFATTRLITAHDATHPGLTRVTRRLEAAAARSSAVQLVGAHLRQPLTLPPTMLAPFVAGLRALTEAAVVGIRPRERLDATGDPQARALTGTAHTLVAAIVGHTPTTRLRPLDLRTPGVPGAPDLDLPMPARRLMLALLETLAQGNIPCPWKVPPMVSLADAAMLLDGTRDDVLRLLTADPLAGATGPDGTMRLTRASIDDHLARLARLEELAHGTVSCAWRGLPTVSLAEAATLLDSTPNEVLRLVAADLLTGTTGPDGMRVTRASIDDHLVRLARLEELADESQRLGLYPSSLRG